MKGSANYDMRPPTGKSSGQLNTQKIKNLVEPVKISKPKVDPIPAMFSSVVPIKLYGHQVSHHYPGRAVVERRNGVEQANVVANEEFAGSVKSVDSSDIPKYIGSTFHDVPHARQRIFAKPKLAKVPRPYVPPSPVQFAGYLMTNSRTANGTILG